MACRKCGARFNGRKYPTIVGYSTEGSDVNLTIALVQFRSGIHIVIDDVPMNFYPGQVTNLSYALIYTLVMADNNILYFHNAKERQKFIMVYPELQEANL